MCGTASQLVSVFMLEVVFHVGADGPRRHEFIYFYGIFFLPWAAGKGIVWTRTFRIGPCLSCAQWNLVRSLRRR